MRRTLILLMLVLCAGCGGHKSHEATVTAAQLPSAVLQPADLPGFEQFVSGEQVRSDAHAGPRNDPTRFGRTKGWIARYRRTAAVKRGPLVVESRADLFPSADDAAKDLDAYRDEYEHQEATKAVDTSTVGDESHAFTFGSASDRFVVVAWRHANVTESVLVEGFAVTTADALRLARAQEKRIAG